MIISTNANQLEVKPIVKAIDNKQRRTQASKLLWNLKLNSMFERVKKYPCDVTREITKDYAP